MLLSCVLVTDWRVTHPHTPFSLWVAGGSRHQNVDRMIGAHLICFWRSVSTAIFNRNFWNRHPVSAQCRSPGVRRCNLVKFPYKLECCIYVCIWTWFFFIPDWSAKHNGMGLFLWTQGWRLRHFFLDFSLGLSAVMSLSRWVSQCVSGHKNWYLLAASQMSLCVTLTFAHWMLLVEIAPATVV